MPASQYPEHQPSGRSDLARRFLSWVWALAPAGSLGFATAPLMVFAIVRVRHWLHILMALVYVVCVVLMFSNSGYPDDTPQDVTFGWALAVNMMVGTGHGLIIRRKFFELDKPRAQQPSVLQERQQAALALSIENEQARASARKLLESDPARAVELRIGRIDIPDRLFPDGGLIDVNNVPVDMLISRMPELLPYRNGIATGQRFGFASVEDMSVTIGLPPRMLDHAAEMLIFLDRYTQHSVADD